MNNITMIKADRKLINNAIKPFELMTFSHATPKLAIAKATPDIAVGICEKNTAVFCEFIQ